MAEGYSFIPQKKWEKTPTGYYIVPADQLDIKRSKTDENGTQYTWAQLKEQYSGTIDSELKTFNAAYKEFLEK